VSGYSCLFTPCRDRNRDGTENFINLYIKRYSDDFDLNCYTDDDI